jgi:hypothetical protein
MTRLGAAEGVKLLAAKQVVATVNNLENQKVFYYCQLNFAYTSEAFAFAELLSRKVISIPKQERRLF